MIRQIDTMGVSMRYAMKFSEGPSSFALLPTTLASGDLVNEVTPMEFPLLNLITSPVFFLGSDFDNAFAHILLLIFSVFLFLKVYRQCQKADSALAMAWLITPLYGITYIFSIRFMPDYLAFLLMSLGTLYFYNSRSKTLAILFCAIAMMIKPPVAIVWGLLLLKPFAKWRQHIPFLIIALIAPAFYYTLGIKYLEQLSQMPGYFSVEARNPIDALISFFNHPKEIFILITKDLFARYSIVLIAISLFIAKIKIAPRLFVILGLQVMAIAIIDGAHAFMHSYYYIGTGLTTALIFAPTLKDSPKWLQLSALIFLFVINLETSLAQIKPLFRGSLTSECRDIKQNVKQLKNEKKIRTTQSPIPEIGLCMGKISNSNEANFGIYHISDNVSCDHVIYQTKSLMVCQFSKD